MFIELPDHIAKRLEQLAEQEQTNVGDIVERLLRQYTPKPPSGSLADLAQSALELGLESEQSVDTAERSREILNTEYADYIKKRMDSESNDDHNR